MPFQDEQFAERLNIAEVTCSCIISTDVVVIGEGYHLDLHDG